MNFKQIIILAAAAGIMAGCKKESAPTKQPADTTKVVVTPKTKVYLVTKLITNRLDSPLPVTQTETFTYNTSLQLTQHSVNFKSNSENYTTRYAMIYDDGKLMEVDKSGGKYYAWDKILYTYSAGSVKVLYVYPDKKDSVTITLNSKGFAEKMQGTGQFYLFTYDGNGNITNRSQYDNANPTKVTFNNDYTYDKKLSPFSAQRDNNYIVFQAFNDINTNFNNRLSNNLEYYGLTYNKDGYPTHVNYLHGPVTVKTIDYTYTVKNK